MGANRQVGDLLYRSFDIWVQVDHQTIARYRCFEVLPSGKFCVQSKDFYRMPLDDERIRQLEIQFLELFFEVKPSDRSEMYDSVEEAILAHDESFK